MTGRSLLDRLHRATIRVQLPVVLVAVPLSAALYAVTVVPVATSLQVGDASPTVVAAATGAARWASVMLVAVVAFSTGAAALLLRGSFRSTVELLRDATASIASGDFRHRVESTRNDELGRLADAIDSMAERLEALEQSRRRMLACVSHELRTPLTIIQGHAFTLARDEPDRVRRGRLELIQDEATRLAQLVDDLVDASSLHAGGVRLHVERIDVVPLVRAQVDRFVDAAEAAGVDVRCSLPARDLWIDGDATRVGQVVANLLANAVRHAPHGTAVEVRLDRCRRERVRLVVANQAAPMDDAVVGQVFEPFVQGAAHGGSVGLGLAIVRALVAAHGGTVDLDGERARTGDVRFEVQLPAASATPGLRSPRPRRRALRRPSVVVAVER